jgi:hypothetical protein
LASGGGTSAKSRTNGPNKRSWSIVCGAPQSRSSPGRSAVSTISGTLAWLASTTAGRKFAAAVPEVQISTAGRRLHFARPRAKKPAARSST